MWLFQSPRSFCPLSPNRRAWEEKASHLLFVPFLFEWNKGLAQIWARKIVSFYINFLLWKVSNTQRNSGDSIMGRTPFMCPLSRISIHWFMGNPLPFHHHPTVDCFGVNAQCRISSSVLFAVCVSKDKSSWENDLVFPIKSESEKIQGIKSRAPFCFQWDLGTCASWKAAEQEKEKPKPDDAMF